MFDYRVVTIAVVCLAVSACGSDDKTQQEKLSDKLEKLLEANSAGVGLSAYQLPAEDDFDQIPQDPSNPLTAEKVALGKLLFHETALAMDGVNSEHSGQWSCASCHQAAAGFKAGILQGIGEGGEGYGLAGEGRVLSMGFDGLSDDPVLKPDVQPVTSPAVLNAAYQEVMLWNGQFGNKVNGVVNIGLAPERLATAGTPKAENSRQLAGLETQAVAGLGVHRLRVTGDSALQTNSGYQTLFEQAYPQGSADALEDAAKAIAAYERTIIANQSPFQYWLAGDRSAMSEEELAGALLFFGEAGCSDCHRGPALSSELGAGEEDLFMALGFADFDPNHSAVTGVVDEASSKGRGGFTGEADDNYKFKVPQLYNLLDTTVFGHGGSFTSVRDVVAYKNAAIAQETLPPNTLDTRFQPLFLSEQDIDNITAFLEISLYDPNLLRYQPASLPTGACFPNNDPISRIDLNCD